MSGEENSTWQNSKLTDFKNDDDVPRERAGIIVPIQQILERLKKATNDNWPATPETRVFHTPESTMTAGKLVEQPFREYERTEEIKELLRALGKLPPAEEHHHHD